MSDTLRAQTLHAAISSIAALQPHAPALFFGDSRMSYGELDAQSTALASELIARGLRRGDIAGIMLARGPQMIVAILGVLKAGAAYVPLDPAYPPERLAFMREDSRARLVLTQRSNADTLPHDAATVFLEECALDGTPACALPAVDGGDLAYVIYTSGSTGKPKGVMIEHHSAVAYADAMRLRFGVDASERMLGATSLSFDVSVHEIFVTLCAGGAIVIVENLFDLIHAPPREPVTTIMSLPTPVAEVVRAGAVPPSVRRILLGGETLSKELVRRIYRTTQVETLFNCWGATEDTVATTVYPVPRDGDSDPPLGEPIDGRRIMLLDEALRPVTPGTPGELCCGGNGLARGYLHRDELTAERFVADLQNAGERIYRSGDLAVVDEAGALRFIGRRDNQVKIRGYRVELGEVEAALRDHPAFADVAVVARDDGSGLAICVFAVETAPVTLAGLRAFCADRLPEQMMPAQYVALDAMPLGPAGKLDRKALQLPARRRADIGGAYAAPAGELELWIARIFATALALDAVGRDDNFFVLGGQSLLATRVLVDVAAAYPSGAAMLRDGRLAAAFRREPSVRGAARALLDGDALAAVDAALPSLVRAGSGMQPPVFLFHGVIRGDAFYVWNFAESIDPARAVYAIAPPGLDGSNVPDSIAAMADAALEFVRATQPEGPYLLAGYCNGGMVALEVAARLEAAGERVERVVLAGAPGLGIRFEREHRLASRLVPSSAPRLRRTLFLVLRGLRLRADALRRGHMRGALKRPGSTTAPPGGVADDRAARDERRYAEIVRAYERHVPSRIQAPLTLVWGRDDAYLRERDVLAEWRGFGREVSLVLTDGDHDFVESQAAAFAEATAPRPRRFGAFSLDIRVQSESTAVRS